MKVVSSYNRNKVIHLLYFIIPHIIVPSSAPVNAVVSAISSTEIMVTWNPVSPIDQNGIITKYEVMYQPLETFRGSIETQTVNVTQSEMSMTLVGLQEFINYSVSIRAYTSVGAGPYSRERRVLTSEDGEYHYVVEKVYNFMV